MLEFGAELTLLQSVINGSNYDFGAPGEWCSYLGYSPLELILGLDCYYEQYGPGYGDYVGERLRCTLTTDGELSPASP